MRTGAGAGLREEAATPHQLAGRLVVAWLAARTLGWALLMTARPNPPLDLVEWLSWGREWQLGYHKHPPLAAWVAEVGRALTPGSFFGIYLLGYLAVALALWSVWNLAAARACRCARRWRRRCASRGWSISGRSPGSSTTRCCSSASGPC